MSNRVNDVEKEWKWLWGEVSGQRVVAADSYVDPTDHFGNESCHSFTWLCPGHQDDHTRWCWRGASPLKWKFWSWPIPLCAQAGPDGLPARLSVEWSAHNWNWATTNPREWNPRWTRWHRHPFRAYFSTSVCLFKFGRFPWHCPLPCLKVSGSEQALDKIACSSIGEGGGQGGSSMTKFICSRGHHLPAFLGCGPFLAS